MIFTTRMGEISDCNCFIFVYKWLVDTEISFL